MDFFSKFFDDDFNTTDWLNQAFRLQKESNQTVDNYTGTLITKLQMYIQEMNNTIEETSQQAVQQFPRVLREIDVLRHEATLLQEQMRTVRGDIQKVNQDTADGMKNLIELDLVKNRIQSASKALQEADNWVTLSAQIDDVFETKDTVQIATKLIAMQQSLKILTDVPDYADRVNRLETLKNRLEALMSPTVIAAFNTQDVEMARSFAQVFQSMDRAEQLEDLYVTSVKTRLDTRIRELMDTTVNDQESIFQVIYDYLSSIWHDEMRWCTKIFNHPTRVTLSIVFNGLKIFHQKYQNQFQRQQISAKKRLETYLACKRVTDRFGKLVQNQLQVLYRNVGSPTSLTPPENIPPSTIEAFVFELYSPYTDILQNYSTYEQEQLKTALDAIQLDTSDTSSSIQLLASSIPNVFSIANETTERCKQLANGRTIISLLNVLQTFFINYLGELKRVVNNIRERHAKVLGTEDWELFRQTIRILETCGDLILAYEQFQSTLAQQILQMINEWQTKTLKHKQHEDTFELAIESFINKMSSAEKYDFLSIANGLENATYNLFPEISKQLSKFSTECHRFSFDVVFLPIHSLLNGFSKLSIWSTENRDTIVGDLPSFSIVPQENITKIGQYLLMLPQYLEPFNLHDNRQLGVAFKKGKLPYLEDKEFNNDLTSCWLDSIALATVRLCIDQTLQIPTLSSSGRKQLIMDLQYLSSVLDDFGLKDVADFQDMIELLKVDIDKFDELAGNKPTRMVIINTIRTMRKL